MPKIPDRWIPYFAYGKVIEGTRIICFKVPLRRSCQVNNREIEEIWDIKTLLKKIPKLGAVIDLTNTWKYYDPKELMSAGVLHKKILMPGRIVPPEDKVTEFMDTVDDFLQKDEDSLVGVHCTHGLNRTGYMVCRYLRDRLHVPPSTAIEKFEKARGYKIERENFIEDIMKKVAGDTKESTESSPKIESESPARSDSKNKRHRTDEDENCRKKTHKESIQYSSPLATYEQEVDGYTMRYEKKRFDRNSHRRSSKPRHKRKERKDSFDYRFDY